MISYVPEIKIKARQSFSAHYRLCFAMRANLELRFLRVSSGKRTTYVIHVYCTNIDRYIDRYIGRHSIDIAVASRSTGPKLNLWLAYLKLFPRDAMPLS